MNNLEKIFGECKNFEQYTKGYFAYLGKLLNELDLNKIGFFVAELEDAYRHENTVFIAGNGGSAATASHMANDLGVDVFKKSKCGSPFKVLALTDNNSVMTAIANDDGYENLFVNQLKIHYRPGDKLLVISASGNSPNLVEAVKWVKSRGGKTLGFTGFDGGKLKELCDLTVHVSSAKGEYGPVEDVHLILDHLVATWLQYRMKDVKEI
jgi:D-sedoheptulose 7-phosphate isomerase